MAAEENQLAELIASLQPSPSWSAGLEGETLLEQAQERYQELARLLETRGDLEMWRQLRELNYGLFQALKELSAEDQKQRQALQEIAAVENTRVKCHLHGGEVGADDDSCSCYLALDAAEKAREIAAKALVSD